MRRYTALVMALLFLLAACTDDEEPPEPVEEEVEEDEERPPQGLRVGVVLPPLDVGTADEVVRDDLGFDALADRSEEDVAELRALVPDGTAFVADVTTLVVVEGYDLVCVFGRDAASTVEVLAARHGATTFCAAPVDPADEYPANVVAVDLAIEELGHVVGVALGELGGQDPVALLGAGNRAGGEAFRSGLRVGLGETPLRESRGELDDLEAELESALAEQVAAIAVDAGPEARELLEGGLEVPLLAPAPLLESESGALRWRVRWDLVLETVIGWHLEGDEDRLPRLGMGDGVFEVQHGPQAGPAVVAAIEEAMGELERQERDPLEAPVVEEDEDDGDADD